VRDLADLRGTAQQYCMRPLKETCLGLRKWTCPFEVVTTFELWITTYHAAYLHAALGDKTPRPFEQDDSTIPSPPFLAA
jgi:hypothetical protein